MKALPIFLALFWPLALCAQFTIEWERATGSSQALWGESVIYNENSHRIWGGGGGGGLEGDRTAPPKGPLSQDDCFVFVLDEDGNLLQDFTFGGIHAEGYQGFIKAGDGFLLTAQSDSRASGDISQELALGARSDIWTLRLDGQGNKIWDRRYASVDLPPSAAGNVCYAQAAASDGGFLLGASSQGLVGNHMRYAPFGGFDIWLLRINADGDTLWTRRFGGDRDDECWAACQTHDGGWAVAGRTLSLKGGSLSQDPKGSVPGPSDPRHRDIWLLRLDDQGNLLWERRFGSSGDEEVRDLLPLPDGSLIATGWTSSFPDGQDRTAILQGSDPWEWRGGWVIKIDPAGNRVMDWTFGAILDLNDPTATGTTVIYDILPLPAGGYLLTGYTPMSAGPMKAEPSRGGWDGWVIQTDENFNIIWEKTIGGSRHDQLFSADNGRNGAVYLGGRTSSPPGPFERKSPLKGNAVPQNDPWFRNLWFLKLVPTEPMALHDTDIKGQWLEKSARITFAPQPVEVVDILVERTQDLSARPVRFQTIAQIEAGQVCGTAECQWLDREPLPGSNFYRLAYRLSDGSRVYSSIVQLTFESHQSPEVIDFRLYPNPTQGPVHLDFQSRLAGQARLELFSTDGRAVFTQTLSIERGANAFDLELDLPAGIYLMRFGLPDGTAVRERMLVR